MLVAAGALALGCSAGDGLDSAGTQADGLDAQHTERLLAADTSETAAPADEADTDATGDVPTAGGGGAGTGFDLGEIGAEVAVEMRVTMRSDDLRATVDGILATAAASGGGVAASDVDYGTEHRDGRATLVVKVPPRSLNALLGGLDDLGTVVSIGQDAVDVSDQLTDLDVRIRNAEQSVDRVRGLLAEATDLREVIDLESELTRRQTDLERLQATQRDLHERVALATVTIRVLPTDAPVEHPAATDPGLADGLRTGWDAFVGVLFAVLYGAAVIAPVLAVALVGAIVAWRLRAAGSARRRGDHGTAGETDGSNTSDENDESSTASGARDAELTASGPASRRP